MPFALLGGAAVGLGVGDQLTAALAPTPLHWVLVPADFGLSTPVVYGTLDALRATAGVTAPDPGQVEAGVLAALRAGDARRWRRGCTTTSKRQPCELAPSLAEVLAEGSKTRVRWLRWCRAPAPPWHSWPPMRTTHRNWRMRCPAHGHRAWAVQGPVHGAHIVP